MSRRSRGNKPEGLQEPENQKQEEFPLTFYFILGPLDFIVRLLLWQWFGPSCFMTTHEVKFYRKRETHQSWLYSSFCWSANMSLKNSFYLCLVIWVSLVLFLFPFACVVVSSKSFLQNILLAREWPNSGYWPPFSPFKFKDQMCFIHFEILLRCAITR